MGQQVIKQPNGLFAIFDTGSDTITVWDATADEIVEEYVNKAAEKARGHARNLIAKVDAGEARRAYFQFAMTWEEALEQDREHGGTVSADS